MTKIKVTVDDDNEPLIPPYFFAVNERFILFKLLYCQKNEIKSKHFLKNFIILQKIILILQSVGKQEKCKI